MPCVVYDRILMAVLQYDTLSKYGRDATELLSATMNQKLVDALRQLSLGVFADAVTENAKLPESRLPECRKKFVRAVVACFKKEYFRNRVYKTLEEFWICMPRLDFPEV